MNYIDEMTTLYFCLDSESKAKGVKGEKEKSSKILSCCVFDSSKNFLHLKLFRSYSVIRSWGMGVVIDCHQNISWLLGCYKILQMKRHTSVSQYYLLFSLDVRKCDRTLLVKLLSRFSEGVFEDEEEGCLDFLTLYIVTSPVEVK